MTSKPSPAKSGHPIIMDDEEIQLLRQEHQTSLILRHLPAKIAPYAELLRLHRRTFIFLSLLPSLLGLLLAANLAFDPLGATPSIPLSHLLTTILRLLCIALLLASSLGTLNDWADASCDAQHPRRRMQPVARRAIRPATAFQLATDLAILTSTAAASLLPKQCSEYAIFFLSLHAAGLLPAVHRSDRALLHSVSLTLGVWASFPALGVPLGLHEPDFEDTMLRILEKRDRAAETRHWLFRNSVFGFWLPDSSVDVFNICPWMLRHLGDPAIVGVVLLSIAVWTLALGRFVLRSARIVAFDGKAAHDPANVYCNYTAKITLGVLGALHSAAVVTLVFLLNESCVATGAGVFAALAACTVPPVWAWVVAKVDLKDSMSCEVFGDLLVGMVGGALLVGLAAEYLAGVFLLSDLGLFVNDVWKYGF